MPKISGLPEDTAPTSDDYVPSLDNGTSTLKKSKWSTIITMIAQSIFPKLSNPYKFRVNLVASFSLTASNFSRIPFDTRNYDTSSSVDITTNKGRFTATVAGFYSFNAHITIGAGNSLIVIPSLYKNGAEYSRGTDIRATIPSRAVSVEDSMQLAIGDTVEFQVYGDAAYGIDVSSPSSLNYFTGAMTSNT